MNLIKQENDVEQSTTTDLFLQMFGPAVSLAIGDPTGISAAAITVISKWGLERFLVPQFISKRSATRLYQWGKQASEGIAIRISNGEEFRKDGFFSETPTKRSNMDEVVESTLKTVIETTEEPKIRYMSYLTENVPFDSDLDIDTYRRLLKILDELSYRQLCLVKLFMNADRIDLDSLGNPIITQNLLSILTDCIEVRDKGLINSNNPLMEKIRELYLGESGDVFIAGGKPPKYSGFSNNLSDNLFKFAKLDQIPDDDVDAILLCLQLN